MTTKRRDTKQKGFGGKLKKIKKNKKKIKKMDPLTLGLITAGGTIAGQGINALTQSSMNKKTQQYNQHMYAQQRKDSLADWTMQNEYNSPQAQMNRLKTAGLNPNLIYGKIENSSSPVRTTDMKAWNPTAPQFDLGQAGNEFAKFYDFQVKQAQLDNLTAQNDVIKQDALLKASQIVSQNLGQEKTTLDNQLTKQFGSLLKQSQLDVVKQQIKQMEASTTTTIDANERAAAMNSMNLKEAAEKILTMRMDRSKTIVEKDHIKQQIENLKSDNRLKELDINLKNMGIQPSDNMALRMLAQLLSQTEIGQKLKKDYMPNLSKTLQNMKPF